MKSAAFDGEGPEALFDDVAALSDEYLDDCRRAGDRIPAIRI